jgi:hypothetical protein
MRKTLILFTTAALLTGTAITGSAARGTVRTARN